MLGMLLGRTEPRANDLLDERWWSRFFPTETSSGEVVTPDTSLESTVVYACVRVLAEAVAALPLKLYERTGNGGKQPAQKNWLYKTLHDKPNFTHTPIEFWELAMQCLTLRGNFLAEVNWNMDTLWPILPDQILEIKPSSDGYGNTRPMYRVRTDSRRGERLLRADDVIHIRGMGSDGIVGYCPITLMRNAIGMSKGAERFGASMFKNGVKPSGVYEHPTKLTDQAMKRLRDSMDSSVGSENANKTMILEEGMKWHQVSMTNEDAQFLETRKLQIEEIARAYRVPMHMLQSLENAHYNNVEHMQIEFVVHTLRPWLVRIEQAIKRDLILQEDKFFAEFLVDGLLRGDISSRYAAYQIGIANEFLSPDEVRQKENMNPRPDGKGGEFKNPAINPKEGMEGAGDKPKPAPKPAKEPEKPKNAAQELAQVYARDLAQRFAERELHQIQKRAKHASGDRAKFNEWLLEFYSGHAQYVDQQLSGFCGALQVREMDRIAVVEKLSREQAANLREGDPEQLAEQWSKELAQTHYSTLMEMVA